jgi:hypothetical protein
MPRKRASFRGRDIGGPPKDQTWCWYTPEMLRSDAWRDMSINARRMLDLLEIEHMAHGGRENGNLIVTFDEFQAYGIRRQVIARTIAELERLGWIEVQRGLYRGFARSMPNRFRLTARLALVANPVCAPYYVEGTHEWRRYRSPAGSTGTDTVTRPKKIRSIGAGTGTAGSAGTGTLTAGATWSRSRGSAPLASPPSVPVPAPLSISRAGGGTRRRGVYPPSLHLRRPILP